RIRRAELYRDTGRRDRADPDRSALPRAYRYRARLHRRARHDRCRGPDRRYRARRHSCDCREPARGTAAAVLRVVLVDAQRPRRRLTMDLRTLAEGLQFPEGPVALADGSVILVEIAAGALTRVAADG